jgi:ankyrin repeat protein
MKYGNYIKNCFDVHNIKIITLQFLIGINQKDKNDNTFLHYLCKMNYHDLITTDLYFSGIDVNSICNERNTALITAAIHGNDKCIEKILENEYVDVTVTNWDKNNALMCAAKGGWHKCVELLFQKGININLVNRDNRTALIMAAHHGYGFRSFGGREKLNEPNELIDYDKCIDILCRYEDINVNIKDRRGDTALTCVAEVGTLTSIEILCRNKNINVNICDCNGNTALIYACSTNKYDVVKYLCERDDTDVNFQNNSKMKTALMVAVDNGNDKCVEILYAHEKIDITLKNSCGHTVRKSYGHTAFFEACRRGNAAVKCVKILLENEKIDIREQCFEGNTPLMNIISSMNEENAMDILKVLCQHKDIDKVINYGKTCTALTLATRLGYCKVIELLLQVPSIDINTCSYALIIAAENGFASCIDVLRKHPGINLNYKNYEGNTALNYAVKGNHHECTKALLQISEVDPRIKNNDWNTPFLTAAHVNSLECLKVLYENIKNNFDINEKNKLGNTALIGCIIGTPTDSQVECLKFLCQIDGIDINCRNNDNNTPLIIAIKNINCKDNINITSLIAIKNMQLSCVDALLQVPGIDVDAKGERNCTALMHLAHMGLLNKFPSLLKMSKDVNAQNNIFNTALILAASAGSKDCVQCLCDTPGIDVTIRNKKKENALDVAINKKHEECISILKKYFQN